MKNETNQNDKTDNQLEDEQSIPPAPKHNDKDSVADLLTSKELDQKVNDLVDQRLKDAQEAEDEINPTPPEEKEKEESGIGMFPILTIGAILVIGGVALFTKTSSNTDADGTGEQNHG